MTLKIRVMGQLSFFFFLKKRWGVVGVTAWTSEMQFYLHSLQRPEDKVELV